jgi:hypothetical protein
MRISPAILVAAAVVLALPAGWGLGVVIAYAIAGPDFGQLPALTVSISIIATIVFALLPSIAALTRLAILAAATGVFVLVGFLAPHF